MRTVLVLTLAVCVAACSTPAARRADPPLFAAETTKSVTAFSGCFIDFYQSKQMRPTFTPRTNGGSIEFNVGTWASTYTTALIDIDDLGDRRRIQFFAQGRDKELTDNINACL